MFSVFVFTLLKCFSHRVHNALNLAVHHQAQVAQEIKLGLKEMPGVVFANVFRTIHLPVHSMQKLCFVTLVMCHKGLLPAEKRKSMLSAEEHRKGSKSIEVLSKPG